MLFRSLIKLVFLFFLSNALAGQSFEEQMHQLLSDYFERDEPGGAVLIKKGRDIKFSRGYGLSDLVTKEPNTPNSVFNTGSISKTFVASAILILHEQGKLDIQDPISKYFEFDHPDIVQDVKIVHLLSHTSGLPDSRNVGSNHEFYMTAKDAENFNPLLATSELNFPVGSQFQYSNPAYNGLALIIEKISGKKWQIFVTENIFSSSHMPTSQITDGSHPDRGVAHAYDQNKNQWIENDCGEFSTFTAAGNGGIWSSVLELANYENAIQNRVFLSDKMAKSARSPYHPKQWSADLTPAVGYGWWMGEQALFSDTPFGKHMIFHTGSQGGFRGYYIVVPEEEILLVALFNRPVDRRLIREMLFLIKDYRWLN